jgi:hypothetical protein
MHPVLLALLLAALPASAREVGGVSIPDTSMLGGKTLRLNGAGVRSKFFISIYVGALYLEAFEANNPPSEVAELNAGLMKFHDEVMSRLTVRTGQTIVLAYRPGAGTELTVPGGASSLVAGRRFGDAILRTWIGDRPSDGSLKSALLGKS